MPSCDLTLTHTHNCKISMISSDPDEGKIRKCREERVHGGRSGGGENAGFSSFRFFFSKRELSIVVNRKTGQ